MVTHIFAIFPECSLNLTRTNSSSMQHPWKHNTQQKPSSHSSSPHTSGRRIPILHGGTSLSITRPASLFTWLQLFEQMNGTRSTNIKFMQCLFPYFHPSKPGRQLDPADILQEGLKAAAYCSARTGTELTCCFLLPFPPSSF